MIESKSGTVFKNDHPLSGMKTLNVCDVMLLVFTAPLNVRYNFDSPRILVVTANNNITSKNPTIYITRQNQNVC